VPFDPGLPVSALALGQILEAARWAPTAHNMQNFEIVVVDDRAVLQKLAAIASEVTQAFVDENYALLSFSEKELETKTVGLLGNVFPPSWRDPKAKPVLDEEHAHSVLGAPISNCGTLLVVARDASKRAPASEGDLLGTMSLGCVMQNMWLMAEALGIGFQVQSSFGAPHVDAAVRELLAIPDPLRIAFAVRLGYPIGGDAHPRVRRDVEQLAHRNKFGVRL
jgi:nitroreductase